MAYNLFPYICHVSCGLIINPVPRFDRENINNYFISVIKPYKKINREITIKQFPSIISYIPCYNILGVIDPPIGSFF